MPTKTELKSFRLSPETVKQILDLGARWSQGTPLSPAAVVTEAVRRAHADQPKEKRR